MDSHEVKIHYSFTNTIIGQTPVRREFRFPRNISKTDSHGTLLDRFREDNVVNLSQDEDSVIEEEPDQNVVRLKVCMSSITIILSLCFKIMIRSNTYLALQPECTEALQ